MGPIQELTEFEGYPGLGRNTAKKLRDAGISNLIDLASKSSQELVETARIGDGKARELVQRSIVLLQESGLIQKEIVTASELYRRRKSIRRFKTGSSALDDLLMGGVESQSITELYGEFASGKTQLCHTLAALSQSAKSKVTDYSERVLYVDTEGTFRPQRLFQIAEARGMDAELVLENVLVASISTASILRILIQQLGKIVKENGVRLIILDSLVALHRAEFAGKGLISERQQNLNRILSTLRKISETTDSAVVVTNEILARPDVSFPSDPVVPAGGNIIAHGTTYRIYLRKFGNERIASFQNSPYHPPTEARFSVTDLGCCDSPENQQAEGRNTETRQRETLFGY